MPKIKYQAIKMRKTSLDIIEQANRIIDEYAAQGFDLTLRQLFYQFVARDILPNTQQSYKRLASIINDGRLAGLIDWNRIEDRTRGIESLNTFVDPSEIISNCVHWFRVDLWKNQRYRPEVWIEKEALAGIFQRICNELRVPYLSCRGYTSQSEMWRAGQRMQKHNRNGQTPVVLHFGDHDPSGIDMSRDIADRIAMFTGKKLHFERLALNMDQVEEYNPPPNPAKMTDVRADGYVAEYGDESWELDALDPTVLSDLVRNAVDTLIDKDKWQESVNEENEHKRLLGEVSERWDDLTEGL